MARSGEGSWGVVGWAGKEKQERKDVGAVGDLHSSTVPR